MESEMARPHGHGHEQEPQVVENQMEGEDEHHHGKKWVLKKVKAKAKQIKDTFTKHGHGPDHDHDLDEKDDDDDDDDEVVEEPEIHGAPIYDSAEIKSTGTTEATGQSGVNAGRSTAMDVDPLPPERTINPVAGSRVHEHEENRGQPKVNVGLTSVVDEAPKAPQNTPVAHAGTTTDTHHVRDQDPTRTFIPGQEEHSGQPNVNLQRPKGGLVEDPATAGAYTPSNYQTKATDPTGKGGEEAGISPTLSSFEKMSISDESKSKSGQKQNWPTGTEDFHTSLSTGSHDQFSPELTPPKPVTGEAFHSTGTQDHPHDDYAEAKEALDSSRDTASGRQPNQGSYTEKISSATPAIAAKAISAKNVVASKLGYGEQGDTGGHEMHATGDKSKSSMPASTVDYGKKIGVTVTEKLSPVYEKVAGAGSTLMSKIPGTTNTGSEKEHGVGAQDKGVSVKDYFAEKLRPGEEDRALSQVITEALRKKKAKQENKSTSSRPVTEVVSDALHNRNEEPEEITSRPMGKVTESEEVARRLGTTEHDTSNEGIDSSFVNNSNMGVVGKIKGAVGSWFGGKGEETPGSQQSHSAPVGKFWLLE
ncbi:hypothetical protein CISIN_1g007806mg [Citrus sinensis]|uniref:Low-temperature-induced 65 kDa protein n=1 Tax=Citrus sinensis TaxID=2711 RepID=A0A067EXW5_CITSI|nr:hypothetical protein CISIN_1g007806mg [Citrus sinensis]